MTLPIVMIFERHWDCTPKFVIDGLLPDLAGLGYDAFCLEAAAEWTRDQILGSAASGLKDSEELEITTKAYLKHAGITINLNALGYARLAELMRLYVSSKSYMTVAEKIKVLPAQRILNTTLERLGGLSIELKGVDIKEIPEIVVKDISERVGCIAANQQRRDATMFRNLLKLREEGRGVVFLCGACHASPLLAKFKELHMEDAVVCYFVHSPSRFDESCDDIAALVDDTLRRHTHCLTEKEVGPFCGRVISKIRDKLRYKTEILDGNSHSKFLREYFGTYFRTFLRPGDYVDALVDMNASHYIEDIRACLGDAGVPTYEKSLEGRRYLVISGVNTRDVADRIHGIVRPFVTTQKSATAARQSFGPFSS